MVTLKEMKSTILWIALGVLFGFFMTFFIQSFTVIGESMEPTLEDGDRVFINKVTYWYDNPQKGDIVVFPYGDKNLVKRVIAVEGDTISIKGNDVFVNGEKIEESYIKTPTNNKKYLLSNQLEAIKVPQGHIFVLGDNRENSKDSRYIGFVPIESLIGKAMFRYYPFNKMNSF